jgi:predicted  nucleic acid-binding Zn-ribbon protein
MVSMRRNPGIVGILAAVTVVAAMAPTHAGASAPDGRVQSPDARQARECLSTGSGHDVTGTIVQRYGDSSVVVSGRRSDGDQWISRTRIDDIDLCILTSGPVVLDAAGMRIESLGAGAWVVLESRGPRGVQRLQIDGGPAGPQHVWSVDGSVRPFDAAAAAWRDALLAVLATQREISEVRGQRSSLRGRISSIRGRESSLRGEISSIRGRVSSMRGEISSVRGRESSMRGEISAVRGRESSMRGEISALRRRISSLENARGATTDPQTRARLDSEAETVRAAIREVEQRIADYDANARIAGIEQRMTDYGAAGRIAEIERRIAEFNADARIAEVQRRINALDTAGEIAALEREIEALGAEGRIGALEDRRAAQARRFREVVSAIR